ncbi:hypothetical protein SK128_004527, partial [Halocaridina rubra]
MICAIIWTTVIILAKGGNPEDLQTLKAQLVTDFVHYHKLRHVHLINTDFERSRGWTRRALAYFSMDINCYTAVLTLTVPNAPISSTQLQTNVSNEDTIILNNPRFLTSQQYLETSTRSLVVLQLYTTADILVFQE